MEEELEVEEEGGIQLEAFNLKASSGPRSRQRRRCWPCRTHALALRLRAHCAGRGSGCHARQASGGRALQACTRAPAGPPTAGGAGARVL